MKQSDDRIAALEARVARLQERLEARERAAEAPAERPMDRRSLLRGAVAGLVGAAAAPAVFAQPAAAATGDPLLIGQANSTSTANAVTQLSATNSDVPVLRLTNNAALSAENGAQPVLRLDPSTGFIDPSVGDAGDLMVSDFTVSSPTAQGGSYLNFAHTGPSTGDDVFWGNVYTSAYASFIEFLGNPTRVLDTRTGSGDPLARFQTIAINLGESFSTVPSGGRQTTPQGLVAFGLGALINITAVTPAGGGFLSVWPSGPRPNASALNYSTGVTLANFSVVRLSSNDSFLLFASQTTHVLVDVIGFIVPDVGLVGPFQDVSQQQSQLAAKHGANARRRREPRRL